jgi:uncharacterized UBP type Zn finger protein
LGREDKFDDQEGKENSGDEAGTQMRGIPNIGGTCYLSAMLQIV